MNLFEPFTASACWWCGEVGPWLTWACPRCAPLKEEGYRRARDRGTNGYLQVHDRVREVFAENGIPYRGPPGTEVE